MALPAINDAFEVGFDFLVFSLDQFLPLGLKKLPFHDLLITFPRGRVLGKEFNC